MGLPKLETCCCCFDLKTGNIILGCVHAVFSFILMVVMIVTAVMVDSIEPTGDVELDAATTGLFAMCLILVFMYLVRFCFDVVFVYGVGTERQGIIKVYMIVWIVIFLLSMIVFFLNVQQFGAATIYTELIDIEILNYQHFPTSV